MPSASEDDVYSKLFGRPCDGNQNGTAFGRHGQPADPSDYYDVEALADDNLYAVRQTRGYLSITFSVMQILVLLLMISSEGGLAPLNVNPMLGPYPETLENWGAKDTERIVHDGEWWRIFPCPVFLHAGLLHLLGNVSVQLTTGAFFEREWGSVVWCIVYAGSGIGSSILSVCIMPDSIGVGSSGAVCGLFGAKLAEVLCRICERRSTAQEHIGHEVRKGQLGHVLTNVVIIGLFSFVPFIDWAAHLGGFVSGITIGVMFFSCMIRRRPFTVLGCTVGFFLTLTVFSMGIQQMYK